MGLGRMGGNLALQALEKGFRVVGFSRGGVADELQAAGMIATDSLADSRTAAEPSQNLLLHSLGAPVDGLIDGLAAGAREGRHFGRRGQLYWGDSIRRFERLKPPGIHFVDAGTSGGISGARHGACFMVGGEPEAIRLLEPIFRQLAVEGGYVHAGHQARATSRSWSTTESSSGCCRRSARGSICSTTTKTSSTSRTSCAAGDTAR